MKNKQPRSPTAPGQQEIAAKQQRLGAALRENLLRRKLQQRARADRGTEPLPAAPEERDAEK